jgi:flagellar secretion chaperone FliS
MMAWPGAAAAALKTWRLRSIKATSLCGTATVSHAALQQYKSTSNYGGAIEASPHKLVAMLYDGAIERLATARGALLRGEVALKLRMLGSTIASNLDDLYDFMGRRLLLANVHDDAKAIDEVLVLLRQLKSAWDGIASHQNHLRHSDGHSVNRP